MAEETGVHNWEPVVPGRMYSLGKAKLSGASDLKDLRLRCVPSHLSGWSFRELVTSQGSLTLRSGVPTVGVSRVREWGTFRDWPEVSLNN